MDQQNNSVAKTIYLELELVLDIYSLVFWNTRFYLDTKYGILIQNKDVSLLYGKPLHQGIKDLLMLKISDKHSEDITIEDHVQNVLNIFKDSSRSIKPTVPSIHVIRELKKDSNVSIKLFTYIEKELVDNILTQKFIEIVDGILNASELVNDDCVINENSILVFGWTTFSREFEKLTTEKKLVLMYVPQPKCDEKLDFGVESYKSLDKIPFENYSLPEISPSHEGSLLRVELKREIKTAELQFWQECIALERIELQGRVVHGYKRGSKDLGVPTANLEMWQDNVKRIENLLPGVYCGTVQFLTTESNEMELREKYGENFVDRSFQTALSIGWNPSYDNSQRTIEAYILEEFDNDFYGEELKININYYIRAESNYTSLDHLIMAIHNDIETTKHIISPH